MRVIAGSSRGRPLRAPRGSAIRPTSDRVREAIFDILSSVADVEGAHVADLFAGTGAMGIEALSRGASSVIFVDRDQTAIDAIRSNLVASGLAGSDVTLLRTDVGRWLEGRRLARSGDDAGGCDRFDLVFADPPYAFSAWAEVLENLDAEVAVLESDRLLDPPASYDVLRTKRYGTTLVTVVRAAGAIPR